jgi:hypothetical protein
MAKKKATKSVSEMLEEVQDQIAAIQDRVSEEENDSFEDDDQDDFESDDDNNFDDEED